jgi:Protein of unknown function (DUF1761)
MEFITSTIDGINWLAIVLATLATMPVGYLWYDLKLGFGKRWAKLNGLSEKDLGSGDGMAATFAVMIGTSFVTAFLLACLMAATDTVGFWNSLAFGLLFGAVFRGGAHFVHNGFTRKPMELTLIDVGHDIVSVTVMALILGLWR